MNIKDHIEAGHYPKDEKGRALVPMRNGKTAIIYLTDFDNPDFLAWEIVGRIKDRVEMEPRCWQSSGGFHGTRSDGSAMGSPLDLLPPPPRKVKVSMTVRVEPDGPPVVTGWETFPVNAGVTPGTYLKLGGEYEEPWS